jgi:hypothetical protein
MSKTSSINSADTISLSYETDNFGQGQNDQEERGLMIYSQPELDEQLKIYDNVAVHSYIVYTDKQGEFMI